MLNDFFAENMQSTGLFSKDDYHAKAAKCDFSAVNCLPLAMAYVPMQEFTNVSTPEAGLAQGTIFRDLVLPFEGGKGGWRR